MRRHVAALIMISAVVLFIRAAALQRSKAEIVEGQAQAIDAKVGQNSDGGVIPCEPYWTNDVIFAGIPIEITQVKNAASADAKDDEDEYPRPNAIVRFRVEKVYQGIEPQTREVSLKTRIGDNTEGLQFNIGTSYLVYANKEFPVSAMKQWPPPEPTGFLLGPDSQTKAFASSAEDIRLIARAKELRAGFDRLPFLDRSALSGNAISLPKPSYPDEARHQNAKGLVMVVVILDEEAKVSDAFALCGHPLLNPAAEAAARISRFSPTMLSGKPVKVKTIINYHFDP